MTQLAVKISQEVAENSNDPNRNCAEVLLWPVVWENTSSSSSLAFL